MADDKTKPGQTTPPPTAGSPRPGEGDIRVLLVGINNYANIRNLGGCIDDLDRVEEYLKKRYEITDDSENISSDDRIQTYIVKEEGVTSLSIYRLEDEQATYTNIITAFQEYLKPVAYPDRAWFHFSGHGTESPTASVFVDSENGKDQCLMCHDYVTDESGVVHNLLADKEMAVLLNEVAGDEKFKPHVLVTIDSCHSGGLTRDPERSYRNAEVPDTAKARELNTYYGNYDQQEGNIVIPRAPHVVITACNAKQLAEEKDGGFFTNALIDTLEATNGNINYADLLVRSRSAIKKRTDSQTPQFEVMGGATAYSRFLEGSYWGDQNKFEVSFFQSDWTIACGAMQGLASDFENLETVGDTTIEIFSFDQADGDTPIAKGKLKQVGSSHSTIMVTEGEDTLANQMNTKTFYGKMTCMPASPQYVLFSSDDQAASSTFEENWNAFGEMQKLNIGLLTVADAAKPHNFEVTIDGNEFRIKDQQSGNFVTSRTYETDTPNEVFISLIKMVKWYRLKDLNNTDPNSSLKDRIKLTVKFEGENNWSFDAQGMEANITATSQNGIRGNHPLNRKYLLLPEISITGHSKPLHFYLLSQFSSFKITGEDEKKSLEVLDGQTDRIAYLSDGSRNWGLNSNEDQDTVYFKLLVSESEVDHFQFLQENLNATRGEDDDFIVRSNSRPEDWCAITLKVDLTRENATIESTSDQA